MIERGDEPARADEGAEQREKLGDQQGAKRGKGAALRRRTVPAARRLRLVGIRETVAVRGVVVFDPGVRSLGSTTH